MRNSGGTITDALTETRARRVMAEAKPTFVFFYGSCISSESRARTGLSVWPVQAVAPLLVVRERCFGPFQRAGARLAPRQ